MSVVPWGASVPVDERAGLDGTVDADVCVVGLGAAGLAAIGELLRRGATVAGVDAATIGSGGSGRNAGLFTAGLPRHHHHIVEALGRSRAVEVYRLTLAEIDRMAAETPELIRPTGSLRIATSPEEQEDCVRQLEALGADMLPSQPYDGPEGRGLFIPTDGTLDPVARCRVLARRASLAEAQLFERSPVVEVAGHEVVTAGGTVTCRRVVVAIDGGLERVLPELAGRVRTARMQCVLTEPTTEIRVSRPVHARWGWDFWHQLPDGRVLVGSFRDRAGTPDWSADPEPGGVLQAELEHVLRFGMKVFVGITHRWAGPTAHTRDGFPLLEEVRPGVVATGGFGGKANVLGELYGRAAGQLASMGKSELATILPRAS